MRKYYVMFIISMLVIVLGSCDSGSPPELYLKFFIDDWTGSGSSTIYIDYTLENGGESDLENCKIQFGVDTTSDSTRNYTTTKWTSGVDLSKGESHSVSNFSISAGVAINDVYVIASGWDSPEDKAAGPTIIYYDE